MNIKNITDIPEFWPLATVLLVLLLILAHHKLHEAWKNYWAKTLPAELQTLREEKAVRERYVRSLEQAAIADEMEIENLRGRLKRLTMRAHA